MNLSISHETSSLMHIVNFGKSTWGGGVHLSQVILEDQLSRLEQNKFQL